MRKSQSSKLTDKIFKTKEKELGELEELAKDFGRKFSFIIIEKTLVYGYQENRKIFLGTEEKYYRYRKLKLKYKKNSNKNEEEKERYEAHKSFLKSYNSAYRNT
jgi:hypothetical protein